MKKNFKKIISLAIGGQVFLNFLVSKAFAITNPAIGPELGGDPAAAASGVTFVNYFVIIWNAFVTIGALMTIIYFLWGAIEWIAAGGDAGKIEKARNKITQAIIGIVLLVSSFVIIGFISFLFFGEEFSILNFQFTAPGTI